MPLSAQEIFKKVGAAIGALTATQLKGYGFEQFGSTVTSGKQQIPVAESAIRPATLANLCQAVKEHRNPGGDREVDVAATKARRAALAPAAALD